MTNAISIQLTGLDAQDPLAYLAGLGCLVAASMHCRRAGLDEPKMCFDLAGVPRPALLGPFDDIEALLDVLVADLDAIAGRTEDSKRDSFLAFSYHDDKGQPVQDLKPAPGDFSDAAQGWINSASRDDRRTVDWAAAMLTDVAVDRSKGAAKPFALHFTAGQQRFLNVALELLDGSSGKPPAPGVGRDDLRSALIGPWPNDRSLKVFSWSPTQDRPYALRAVDPATDPKLGTPGADWLALRGLELMSSSPRGSSIWTGGVEGKWKTGMFSYPIWPRPLDQDAVRALLRHPAVCAEGEARGSAGATLPRGVEVLTCRISRSDQGGYGSFSRPSRR